MIPFDFITEWRQHAPWVQDAQVEQDLLISRVLVELFNQDAVYNTLALRGGTALYKLYLRPAVRYSEDIDLVQVKPGGIGATLDAIRALLHPWFGDPKHEIKKESATLLYRTQSEGMPQMPLRLKIEINTREHFSVFDLEECPFAVESRWFSGNARIKTYHLDELLGTKMRALYQRKKGRDFFDLWYASRLANVDAKRVVDCFMAYLGREDLRVSRAQFEENLDEKLSDAAFLGDITPLLTPNCPWDLSEAGRYAREKLLARLPGDEWKGSKSAQTPRPRNE